MKHVLLQPFFLISILFTSQSIAQTLYITDEFKVTLRTGPSTSNSIVSMLKSGQSVELIQHDQETKYSEIKLSNDKTGFVLTRFLETQPSHKERLANLQSKNSKLNQNVSDLNDQVKNLSQLNEQHQSEINDLSQQLINITNQFNELNQATQNTQQIIEQNADQESLILELENEKERLIKENKTYKDSTAMDWFVRGAGVSLIAFLIGIIVTKIQWKRRKSWDEF